MRNKQKTPDERVFAFINNKRCQNYRHLQNFCFKNNLPFYPRWVFYLFGKMNLFKKSKSKDIFLRIRKNVNSKYGYFKEGIVYYWNEYLSDEVEKRKYICETLISLEYNPSEELIEKIFVKRGWDYASMMSVNAADFENNRYIGEARADVSSEYEFYDESDNYCSACMESPCACSNRGN